MKFTRKLLVAALLCMLALALSPAMALAADDITVTIDGQAVDFEGQGPVMVDDVTLVPVRFVFENLGFAVTWDSVAREATLSRDDFVVVIAIGSTEFTTNGESNALGVPAQLIGGRTMVPLRPVLESVGYIPDWDGDTRTIIILTTAVEDFPPIDNEYPAEVPDDIQEEIEDSTEEATEDTDIEEYVDTDIDAANDTDADEDTDANGYAHDANDFDPAQLVGIWEADTDVFLNWWGYEFHPDGTVARYVPLGVSHVFQWAIEGDILQIIGNYDYSQLYVTLDGDVLTLTDTEDETAYWVLVRRETRSWLNDALVGDWEWRDEVYGWRELNFAIDGSGIIESPDYGTLYFFWFVYGDVIFISSVDELEEMYFILDGDELTLIHREFTELYMVYTRVN